MTSSNSPKENQLGSTQQLRHPFISIVGAVRLLNVLFPVTSFVPDEYWQALEVAHRLVFGYGHLTWEWHAGIRGYSYPLLLAALYKVLAVFHLDYPLLLIYLPRFLHLPLAIISDIFVFKLTSRLFSRKIGQYALVVNLLSWFTFYCVTRTLTNSVEACLTPVVLYHWMAAYESKSSVSARGHVRLYMLLVGVSVLFRPTGVLMWGPLVLVHLILRAKSQGFLILQEALLVGLPLFFGSLVVDCLCYGKLVVIQWNFFKLNVLEGHSLLYGSKPWFWYWTEGIAVLLTTHLPLMLLGVWLLRSGGWWKAVPLVMGVWVLVFHSFLGHKEHRFILPALPLANIYVGYGAWWSFVGNRHRALCAVVAMLLVLPAPACVYFSVVHQRGSIAVMDFLRSNLERNSSVMFLMPCHTTPFYSHVHMPINMEFLECPPPIGPEWVDVSKIFYSDPEKWLRKKYKSEEMFPSHFVLFDYLVPVLESFMKDHRYVEVHREFHTHFPESDKYSSHIVVLQRTSGIK